MIRKLLVLAGLALVARRLLLQRVAPADRVSLGFADGSAVTLEPGAPGFAPVLDAAREALLP